MLKKSRLINSQVLIVISFAFMAIISMLIVLNTKTFFGEWDAQFHLRRILALEQSIKHGNWLPQFDFTYFHGALDMVMYPYFNLYPIIVIKHLVGSKVISIYIWFMINTFISLLIGFYSSYSTYRSKLTSYIFTTLYSMSGYLFALYMVNMDLGAISAYTVLPLVIFGFINFLKNQNHWVEFATGVSLLIMSHVLSTVICLAFIFILGLMNVDRIRKYRIRNLVRPIILVTCVTSIYWLPFVYITALNHGNVRTPVLMPLKGYHIHEFIMDSFDSFPNYFSLNVFALIAVTLGIFYYHRFDWITKQLYVLSCLTLALCSDLIPWRTITELIPMVNIVQKMYRLFMIPQLILLLILALIVTQYIKWGHWLSPLLIIIMILLQVRGQITFVAQSMHYPIYNRQYLNAHPYERLGKRPDYKLIDHSQIKSLAGHVSYKDDYFPVNLTDQQLGDTHNDRVNYDGHIVNLKQSGYNRYRFRTRRDAKEVRLPFVKFNGQNALIMIDKHYYKIDDRKNQTTVHNLPAGRHSLYLTIDNHTYESLIGLILLMFIVNLLIYVRELIKQPISIELWKWIDVTNNWKCK